MVDLLAVVGAGVTAAAMAEAAVVAAAAVAVAAVAAVEPERTLCPIYCSSRSP